jgi:hypothetical protein
VAAGRHGGREREGAEARRVAQREGAPTVGQRVMSPRTVGRAAPLHSPDSVHVAAIRKRGARPWTASAKIDHQRGTHGGHVADTEALCATVVH